jgi:hypothetical protein
MPPAMPLCSFRANTEAGRALMRPAWRRLSLLRQAAQSPLLPVTAHPVFFRHIEAVKAEYERDGLYEAKKALGQKLFHLLVPESLRFLLPDAALELIEVIAPPDGMGDKADHTNMATTNSVG